VSAAGEKVVNVLSFDSNLKEKQRLRINGLGLNLWKFEEKKISFGISEKSAAKSSEKIEMNR